MRTSGPVYRFGEFELDSSTRRLSRGGEPVFVPELLVAVLFALVPVARTIVGHDALIEQAWHGESVSPNNLEQAISRLKKLLGDQADGRPHIENVARRGYRFIAPVEHVAPRVTAAEIEARFAPHRVFTGTREAIETLKIDAIVRAIPELAEVLRIVPDFWPGHIAMANACALLYESTRADVAPNRAILLQGAEHAPTACLLVPSSGEAFGARSFVEFLLGDAPGAIVSIRTAIGLQPGNWHHPMRLAIVSWGQECIDAGGRVLELYPGLAMGHWPGARVFVARQAFGPAVDELRAGCAAQDAQLKETGHFNGLGLHWLYALVLIAQGCIEQGFAHLEIEFANIDPLHVYGRECAANVLNAMGAALLRAGRRDEAIARFLEAQAWIPGHGWSLAALIALSCPVPTYPSRDHANPVDVALAKAIYFAIRGEHAIGARLFTEAIRQAPPGSAGWLLPAEPSIQALAHPEWGEALAILRSRAY